MGWCSSAARTLWVVAGEFGMVAVLVCVVDDCDAMWKRWRLDGSAYFIKRQRSTITCLITVFEELHQLRELPLASPRKVNHPTIHVLLQA